MNIPLKPATEAYLKAQVEAGRFDSITDAIEHLASTDAAREADLDATDLSWAKPFVEKGLADFEAGRVVPAEAVHEELRRRFGSHD